MEQFTPYEPLRREPLKLSGVFGMAWQLLLAAVPCFWMLRGVLVILFAAAPVLLLWRNPVLMFIAVIVMNGLRLSLVMPFNAVYTTALYEDCAAREAAREAE
jgi:hypothetical protein